MKQRIVMSAVLALVSVAVSGHAGDWGGKNGSNAGNNVLNGATLDGSRQGQAVGWADIDGDGMNDLVVGAPYASSSSNTGTVLVYRGGMPGAVSPEPYLLLAGDDNFGYSFVGLGDVDGDGREDFAVGAINGDGTDVSLGGSVTIYRGGRNWNYNEGLGKVIAKVSGEGPMDKFGVAAAAADLNGDGRNDLIVGAPYNTGDPALYQGGAVYVYLAPDFTDKIALRATAAGKGLGWSAAAGDVNGDGIADLCMGASGKVLCYYGGPGFRPSTDAPDVVIRSAATGFGTALAVVGDLDGDGFGDIVIGAGKAVVGGQRDTGSIFVVRGGTGLRTINADSSAPGVIVRIDGAALFDRFGASIAPLGDVDGDGVPDFAVGAPMAGMDAHLLAGRVYFFSGMGVTGSATLAAATVFEGAARSQLYGASLAFAGPGPLLIGAPGASMNDGAVSMVDPLAGQAPGDGSGGAGGGGECP